jgi:casein kinase II subunit alpha
MWSVGCMLAGMVFQKEPFFKGADNDDQLIKIAKFLGAEEIHRYVEKFEHIEMSDFFKQNLLNFKKKEWQKYITETNSELVSDEAIDLISKLLKIDHTERITAS